MGRERESSCVRHSEHGRNRSPCHSVPNDAEGINGGILVNDLEHDDFELAPGDRLEFVLRSQTEASRWDTQ